MDNTIIQQGRFVSLGVNQPIDIRSGYDWIETYNYTQALAAQIGAVGVKFSWQAGMPQGSAFETTKGVAGAAGEFVVATGGFAAYDTSTGYFGPMHTADVTAVSAAAVPVVTETTANDLTAGDIIRLTNIAGASQISGMDFTVGYGTLTANTFSLDYMPQIVAGTTGNWQKVGIGDWNAPFYPSRRFITRVTNAAQAVITMSVNHYYTVGQKVRVIIPAVYGMTLPATQGTIVAIDGATGVGHNTITVDIDTTALAAFVFPLTAATPFTFAEVIPVGEDTSTALSTGNNILADATLNVNAIGALLYAGVDSPAGRAGDVIYWKAGKSFNV